MIDHDFSNGYRCKNCNITVVCLKQLWKIGDDTRDKCENYLGGELIYG